MLVDTVTMWLVVSQLRIDQKYCSPPLVKATKRHQCGTSPRIVGNLQKNRNDCCVLDICGFFFSLPKLFLELRDICPDFKTGFKRRYSRDKNYCYSDDMNLCFSTACPIICLFVMDALEMAFRCTKHQAVLCTLLPWVHALTPPNRETSGLHLKRVSGM